MTTELHNMDRINQRMTPTIMVPQMSQLQPCNQGQMRFLMASDGLYVNARTGWAEFTARLWRCDRIPDLPYGSVAESNGLQDVLTDMVLPMVAADLKPQAAAYAEQGLEWAGFIIWDGERFLPHAINRMNTATAVDFSDRICDDIPPQCEIVADVHSHHTMPPVFSADDDASDNGRMKISIALGNYRTIDGIPYFQWSARYCIKGLIFQHNPILDDTEELI